jgi:hypothetical protein
MRIHENRRVGIRVLEAAAGDPLDPPSGRCATTGGTMALPASMETN